MTDHRYTGPGSFYDVVLAADRTFVIEVSQVLGGPVVIRVEGTYERLNSGFLKLTVASATGDQAHAPAPGDVAYALEVPGFALFLRPMGGDELIPMLVHGSCPTQSFSANWIMAQTDEDRPADDPDREWWGAFRYTHGATPSVSVPTRYNLANLEPMSDDATPMEALGCDRGLLQIGDGAQVIANMWLTDGGAMVETFDQGERLQTIFAMRSSSVTHAALAGDYAAFVFSGADQGQIVDAAVSLNDQGEGQGYAYADIETGTMEGQMASISFGAPDHPDPGWLMGSISAGSGAEGNLACSATENAGQSGRTVLVCISQDPEDRAEHLTMVMVSKP